MKRIAIGLAAILALSGCAGGTSEQGTVATTPTPTAAPTTRFTPTPTPRHWLQSELALLKELGVSPDTKQAEEIVDSGWDLCVQVKPLSKDELTIALMQMEPRTASTTVQIVGHLCPREDAMEALVTSAMSFKEGQWRVGDGTNLTVSPGRYRSLPGLTNCYWVRKADDGRIIQNDLVNSAPGGVQVTIKSGDATFDSNRCGGYWLRMPN